MPLYLDTHEHVPGLTAEALTEAHAKDLEHQAAHQANFMRYWFDEATGKVYCLAEAPSAEAMAAVHRDAHGIMADVIVEVREGS
jgi:Nickel responsive protein SCO4226-like